ncbi:MAG TPA: FIST N-terminal domain-containing protein [Planctomycetota bacterium]|nr:FIST N-terminal domain-containing protein [Planctomycetota bacterium]
MKLETLTYSGASGWSTRPFPALDSKATLVIAFGAASFSENPGPLRELRAAYPQSSIVGCSTSGEIFGTALSDDTISVAIARFDTSTLSTASASVATSDDSFAAGRSLAERLVREDLKAILVLSDGLMVNGSELVRGLNSALPESVVVTGGLAGDGDRFKRTWVVGDGEPRSGEISAVGLYGERLHVGHGSKGGWDRFGPERRVTKSKGNVLYELDGKPALELYKQYLGERAKGLPATALLFPLALRADRNDSKLLVRTILGIDEATQSMTFAGDIPEGHLAQLMRANFERLIEGASQAADHTLGREPALGEDTLSIAISCVGRRLILGERTEEEIEAVLAALPKRTKQIGFYSYGEISPYATGRCDLHNQTMTLTTISEG